MNRRNSRPKIPWSHGDKFLMLVLGLVVPLTLVLFFWSRALDQNPVVAIPAPAMPAVNARDYYIGAVNALVDSNKIYAAVSPSDSKGIAPSDGHHYSPADKAKLLAENMRSIQLLHQGFQHPYQELPIRSFLTRLPLAEKARDLSHLLSLQAQTKASHGDWGGAINAGLDAVQLGETVAHGGPLMTMQGGEICQVIGREPAWKTVNRLNAAQAQAAARRLEAIRTAHVAFVDTLKEEKWATQAGILELMERPDWPQCLLTNYSPDKGHSEPDWRTASLIHMTGKRTIMADYTGFMDQAIADARHPYAAHLPDPQRPHNFVSQMLSGSGLDEERLSETAGDTQNALLVTALALRAYRLDHGAYPPTLAALVPGYLEAVPDDPFALSGPLRYKPGGAKYVLYSVGPDGTDDGGKAIFDRTQPAPKAGGTSDPRFWVRPDSRGDVAAGMNMDEGNGD